MIDKTAYTDVGSRTVQDLYMAIMADTGIGYGERQRLISQLDDAFNDAPRSTSLKSVLWKISGGGLGYLISKYFSVNLLGQGVMAALGVGLGTLMYNKLNQPPPPTNYDNLYG